MKKPWKVARFGVRFVAWGFLIASLGLLAAIGVGPHTGRYHTLSVLTGSMRPGIPVGATVIVTPESPRDIRVGQILTFQSPVGNHQVVTHRVIQVVKGEGTDQPVIQTKGDANKTPDPWQARIDSRTAWQVRYSVPRLGSLIASLRDPAIRTGAVQVVPVLLAGMWMISIWRRKPVKPAPADAEIHRWWASHSTPW